jgi:hypothetical protein
VCCASKIGPKRRGAGSSVSLLQALQDSATHHSMGLALIVSSRNDVAKHLYSRCGFERLAETNRGQSMVWVPRTSADNGPALGIEGVGEEGGGDSPGPVSVEVEDVPGAEDAVPFRGIHGGGFGVPTAVLDVLSLDSDTR